MKIRCPHCGTETNILYEVYTGATVRLKVEVDEDVILSRGKYDLSDLDTMTPYYECPECGGEVAADPDKLFEILANPGG
jgi:hypothetical protein